ncbi:DUF4339 domain-containing protein [Edaphobacter albus]|uniref:DUF4339 domain-containing protein n=1 Tax=Edaphobacter sp. 4G125 TaxID=2763071 RepID=UPI001645EDD7|nr:DUF4339 domain-containing protein [Edaphobacter sp. 4G125]QNI37221.1 DUF4339 domain-containing protein [Edaphobacter sp. 4G125]
MPYMISRAGQTYGPYTLEDLQRYVTTGNILLTDLAKSDEMADWIPVAQILNPATAGTPFPGAPVPPAYVPPVAAYEQPGGYAVSPYPDPPNLHWVLVLLFTIFTCGLFSVIWDFVQVLWMKRIEPQTKAFPYFIGYAILSFLNGGVSMRANMMMLHTGHRHPSLLSALISIAVFVLVILYRFSMRDSLERHYNSADPVGLRLGPIMTFFFGGLYFQYHFNRINAMKQALRYRSGF